MVTHGLSSVNKTETGEGCIPVTQVYCCQEFLTFLPNFIQWDIF